MAAAAGDDEAGPLVGEPVEQQRVGAAHEVHAVPAYEVQELVFSNVEAPLGCGVKRPSKCGGQCISTTRCGSEAAARASAR